MRLPGFRPALALTVVYVAGVVAVPLTALIMLASRGGWSGFWTAVSGPRVLASLRLSVIVATIAATLTVLLGVPLAWALARYRWPARRVVNAIVDLPFAMPTAVAGIALTALYGERGWIGAPLGAVGIKVAYTPLGIIVALTFIGLPFVVRSVQPVLADLDPDIEEAAASLGASWWTALRRVILPVLAPAIVSGFTLALARGLGEYGSVIFIAGNMPLRTEIPALLIVAKLDQFDDRGAAAIGAATLALSLTLLCALYGVQSRVRRFSA